MDVASKMSEEAALLLALLVVVSEALVPPSRSSTESRTIKPLRLVSVSLRLRVSEPSVMLRVISLSVISVSNALDDGGVAFEPAEDSPSGIRSGMRGAGGTRAACCCSWRDWDRVRIRFDPTDRCPARRAALLRAIA